MTFYKRLCLGTFFSCSNENDYKLQIVTSERIGGLILPDRPTFEEEGTSQVESMSGEKSNGDSSIEVKPTSSDTLIRLDVPFDNADLKHKIQLLNQELEKYINTEQIEPAQLRDAAYHLLLAGGKRMRSLIVLLSCEAVGGDIQKALPIAVATEFLQTASLIHDDIIDDDAMRRGVGTVHRVYGDKIALLAGDLLIAWGVKIIGEHGTPEILRHIGTGGMQLCEGEAEDLIMSIANTENLNASRYLRLVGRKTASFLRNAALVGTIIGEAPPDQRDALVQYAEMLGYAFQLRDDILDVQSSQSVSGKTVHSDLRWQRCNYPLIHALEVSSESERAKGLSALEVGNLDFVLDLIDRTKAIEHAEALARDYVHRAKRALDKWDFPTRTLLEQVAEFILARQY